MKKLLLALVSFCAYSAIADTRCNPQQVGYSAYQLVRSSEYLERTLSSSPGFQHLAQDAYRLQRDADRLYRAAYPGANCHYLRREFQYVQDTFRHLRHGVDSAQQFHNNHYVARSFQDVARDVRELRRLLETQPTPGPGAQPGWRPVNGADCYSYCASVGLVSGLSPEGAQCVSGENRAASAVGVIPFVYGCWPNCAPEAYSNATSRGQFCYKPGQKADNDRTDITVGCFCR